MVTIEDAQNFLTKDFEKYNHPGIYAIYIDKKLVYIGKSRNMAIRVVSHVNEIENNKKSNKYI